MQLQVGVVVKFPGSVHTECINISEGANGYELMNEISLATEWAFWAQWGHGLCKIGDTGCPASDYYCSYPDYYWAFYINGVG